MLVSTVQQSESAIGLPTSPLLWISFPFRSQHQVKFPILCSRFSLAIYFIHSINNVYMLIPISQLTTQSPSFSSLVSVGLFSTSVSLFQGSLFWWIQWLMSGPGHWLLCTTLQWSRGEVHKKTMCNMVGGPQLRLTWLDSYV